MIYSTRSGVIFFNKSDLKFIKISKVELNTIIGLNSTQLYS